MCSKDAGICPVYIEVFKKIFQSVFFENLSFFCCKFDSADCSTLTLRSHSLRSRQKIIPKKSQLLMKK